MDSWMRSSQKNRPFIALLGGLGMGLLTVLASAQDKDKPAEAPAAESQTASGPPATLAGFSDEGVFYLYVNEDRLATIRFTWKPDGAFEGQSTLTMAGQTVAQSIKITPDADGRWTSIACEAPAAKVTIARDGGTARITVKEKTRTQNLKPDAVLFENFTPALMSQAIRRYDQAKGGKQTFPLFVIPGALLEGSLERKEQAERAINGRDLKFTRYVYSIREVDITVWADDAGKIYLGDIPAQQAAYVREGYEALRKAPQEDPGVSGAKFEIKEERGVGAPMRDGLKLSTDIYRPAADGKFPVILIRTPYKKEMSELQGRYYARRGYVCAIQDCRGRFGSPGEWEPFVNEAPDGYDTVEWLAAQPWSSGKVGMIGGSYVGWVQWWAASQNPPHLTTIIPNVSPPDPFYNFPYEYGAFFLWGGIWWADIVMSEATGDLSGAAMSKIGDKKYGKLLRELPVIELDKSVLGKENKFWRKWIEHQTQDAYWDRASYFDKLEKVNIPVFHQSGWFDGDGIGSKLNYLKMRSHNHANQKLILGPWGHTDTATRTLGDIDFGPEAVAINLQREYLRWFDHWLKGIDNGIDKEPLVSLFVMDANKWIHGDEYPLPQTKFEKWYFNSGGNANTSKGDGRLSAEPPKGDAPSDRYTYNPGDPTPNPSFPEDEDDDKKETSTEEEKKAVRERHMKITDARRDMLVYTSEPFDKPFTFAGPLSAVLYASSSARDTDWYVRVVQIDKDGRIYPLVEGRLRARYRNSVKKTELLEPGKIYEYHLDLWQTAVQMKPGQRLRVEVASASFPFFSRNLNTGGNNETETKYLSAEQTIYHNAQYPSHVLLPVIPEKEAPAP